MASSSNTTTSKPCIGILSIGDMGMGIAKLLLDHEYKVYTVSEGRSQSTIDRIKAAKIIDVPFDEALVIEADIILSIVPPRDAIATAKRIVNACKHSAQARREKKNATSEGIIFIDMNAVSPKTMVKIAGLIDTKPSTPAPATPSLTRRITRTLSIGAKESADEAVSLPTPVSIRLMDAGIIGGPPSKAGDGAWKKPSIPASGPQNLLSADLISVLNMKIMSDKIGQASALKSCFASLSKGLTALAIMSYTTAHTAGVLPDLRSELEELFPEMQERAEKGMINMAPKAYRWVDEMRQIGETLKGAGKMPFGQDVYNGIAEVYRFVADETVLGKEKTGKRKRGTTVEDVAIAMQEGVDKKLKTKEVGDEKLELAWRGSWS